MALTTGEQLQSFDGPMAKFIHRMQHELFEDAQVDKLIGLSTDRGRGFQDLVQTVACIARLPEYTHATYQQQVKLLQSQGQTAEEIQATQAKSERVLRILKDIATNEWLRGIAFPLPNRTSRTSPIEFSFVAILISMWMDKPHVGLNEMATAIATMRKEMKVLHGDMRLNGKIAQVSTSKVPTLKALTHTCSVVLELLEQIPGDFDSTSGQSNHEKVSLQSSPYPTDAYSNTTCTPFRGYANQVGKNAAEAGASVGTYGTI